MRRLLRFFKSIIIQLYSSVQALWIAVQNTGVERLSPVPARVVAVDEFTQAGGFFVEYIV